MAGKWTVQKSEHYENTAFILAYLLEEFSRIFGSDVMTNEDCIVYNDISSQCPRFIHSSPLSIRLHQKSLMFWSQTIFQLSHEMCHYAMHQTKDNKDITLSWFEEIVCEAVSLYALEYASKEWSACKLSQYSPDFASNHKKYLYDELKSDYTDGFKVCDSVDKLLLYEVQKKPENERETHCEERNIIYATISKNPLELKSVLNYTKYIENNGVTIDFDRWIQDNPCNLLQELKKIQPVKILIAQN